MNTTKLKLLTLAKLFQERADERYGLSLAQISAELAKEGICAERGTLYQDIELLRSFGMDIVARRDGRTTLYCLASRPFSREDLAALLGAVRADASLSEEQKAALAEKLFTLGSRQMAAELKAL